MILVTPIFLNKNSISVEVGELVHCLCFESKRLLLKGCVRYENHYMPSPNNFSIWDNWIMPKPFIDLQIKYYFFSLFCTSLSRKWFYHNKRKQNSLQYNWRSWYLIAWFLVHFMILPSTVAKTFSILLFILLTSTTAAIYKWLHHIALWIVFRTVSVNIVVLLTLAKVVYDFNLLL